LNLARSTDGLICALIETTAERAPLLLAAMNCV
jgi:hypothetical protein